MQLTHEQLGDKQALFDIDLKVRERSVTAFIGPSGCGKSTLLRSLNRMNDLIDGVRVGGTVRVHGEDLYAPSVDVVGVRKRLGMVFQKSNPFPKSVFENVVYGLRIHGEKNRTRLHDACEAALKGAALWDEVKDRLKKPAMGMSGGQQQRLCIARTIAVQPEVILMDEPCSALDAQGTEQIEALLDELRERYTIVIVTHNMAQARRASQECIFMLLGRVVEHARTEDLFLSPKDPRTAEYIEGRYA